MPFLLQETMRLLSSLKHRETVKPFSLHCNIFNRKLPSSSSKTHSKADLFCFSLFSVIHQLLHSWMVVLNTGKFSNNDIRYPCEPKGWGCFFNSWIFMMSLRGDDFNMVISEHRSSTHLPTCSDLLFTRGIQKRLKGPKNSLFQTEDDRRPSARHIRIILNYDSCKATLESKNKYEAENEHKSVIY